MKFEYPAYRILLETLLDKHMPVTFLERFSILSPRFIMRHDIDFGPEFIGEIPEIEKSLGVSATYFIQIASAWYNPFCPSQAEVIESLLKSNHRLGLHFDCKGENEAEKINNYINRELELLRQYFGNVDAVSFHDPSSDIISNKIKIPYINTYDKHDMTGFEYFSDSCQRWSKGDPIQMVKNNPETSFQILLHPGLWGIIEQDFSTLSKNAILHKAQCLYDHLRNNVRGVNQNLKCVFTMGRK